MKCLYFNIINNNATSSSCPIMKVPCFIICENKGADQLSGNVAADQRLCLRYTDRKILLLPMMKIPEFYICENKGADQLSGNLAAPLL